MVPEQSQDPNDLYKAVRYQFYGKAKDRVGLTLKEAQERRVLFSMGVNANGASAAHAFADMELHARDVSKIPRRGPKAESHLLHFSVNFNPKDAAKATPEKQREVAHALLARLGLSEHVGLVVSHKDQAHPHMHFVFDRRHPETGAVFENWQLPAAGEEQLPKGKGGKVGLHTRLNHHTRELAREYGFYIMQEKDRGEFVEHSTAGNREAEYWEAKRENRPAFSEMDADRRKQAREACLDTFRTSEDWLGVSVALSEKGYHLGMVGKGAKKALCLYDSEGHKAKLSTVFGKEKDIRLNALTERFGHDFETFALEHGLEAPQPPRRASERPEQAPELAEALNGFKEALQDEQAALEAVKREAAAEATAARMENEAQSIEAELAQLTKRNEQTRAEVRDLIDRIFADPKEANKAFDAYAKARVKADLLARQAFKPESLGAMRGALARAAKGRKIERARDALADLREAGEQFTKERDTLAAKRHSATLLRKDAKATRENAKRRLPQTITQTGKTPKASLADARERIAANFDQLKRIDILQADLPKADKRELLKGFNKESENRERQHDLERG